ncbi:MAG: hypothetical protein DRR42_10315 [Gammaproteobacteria bacterium]|nr:MAG: hypothetical protein DRR42_10315 [Gammaproteobacteria bacterium]
MVANRNQFAVSALMYGIGALSVVFALELVYFAFAGSGTSFKAAAPAQLSGTEALAIRSIGTEDDFHQIVERPLFTLDRKPLAENKAVQQINTVDIESRWSLSAVVSVGPTKHAYFQSLDGGQRVRLEEGMYFEKWKVELIDLEQVSLSSEGEAKTFRMKDIEIKARRKKPRSRAAVRKPTGKRTNLKGAAEKRLMSSQQAADSGKTATTAE